MKRNAQRKIDLRTIGIAVALAAIAIVVAALGSRNNVLPNSDEIYHLLAGASYAEEGTFRIGTGAYERARLYTQAVGVAFRAFGESIFSAQLVGFLSFGALVAVFYTILRRETGQATALLTAFLLIMAPHSLEIAATVRFYMPHSAFFWIGVCLSYVLITAERPRYWLLPLAAVAFGLAFLLQKTTLVGMGAFALWAGPYLAYRVISAGVPLRYVVVGGTAGVVLFAGIAWLVLPLDLLWEQYRGAAPWNEGSRYRYYYWVMTEHYNPLWAVFPAGAILAIWRFPRVAGMVVTMFVAAFVVQSFGGMKEDRYLYYALPAFFAVLAIALAFAYQLLTTAAGRVLEQIGFVSPRWNMPLSRTAGVLAIAFFIVANLGYVDAIKDVAAGTTKREQPRWDLLVNEHSLELAETDVIVTNSSNHALYVLKRNPVSVGYDRLYSGSRSREEFSPDMRTGVILISEPESLERLMQCVQSGLLIAEDRQWRNNPNSGFSNKLADLVEDRMERVTVPGSWDMRLFRWSDGGTQEDGPDAATTCEFIRNLNFGPVR